MKGTNTLKEANYQKRKANKEEIHTRTVLQNIQNLSLQWKPSHTEDCGTRRLATRWILPTLKEENRLCRHCSGAPRFFPDTTTRRQQHTHKCRPIFLWTQAHTPSKMLWASQSNTGNGCYVTTKWNLSWECKTVQHSKSKKLTTPTDSEENHFFRAIIVKAKVTAGRQTLRPIEETKERPHTNGHWFFTKTAKN